MLTLKEIIEVLREEDAEEFKHLDFLREEDSFEARGFQFKHEETQGGGEGDGEEHWIVFSVSKDEEKTFWKIPGWYQSHYGGELEVDRTFEVEAAEKVITVWQAKKKVKVV